MTKVEVENKIPEKNRLTYLTSSSFLVAWSLRRACAKAAGRHTTRRKREKKKKKKKEIFFPFFFLSLILRILL